MMKLHLIIMYLKRQWCPFYDGNDLVSGSSNSM